MNYDQFVAKYNGRYDIDYDRVYGVQCVDLIKYYLRDCFGLAPGAWGDAVAYFTNTRPEVLAKFDKIKNIPTDLNQVPKRGDIIIWSGSLPGTYGAGHIAVYDARVAPGQFRSFDANWGGKYAHFVTHNYNYVLGWLTPKSIAPIGGDEVIATEDEAIKSYKMLRPNGGASPAEISGTAGRRTYKEFLYSGVPEVTARDKNLREQQAQLQNMQTTINQLNQTVTSITAEKNTTKADLEKAIITVGKLTSDLETAHDKIVDLESKPAEDTELLNEAGSWLTKLLNRLFKR